MCPYHAFTLTIKIIISGLDCSNLEVKRLGIVNCPYMYQHQTTRILTQFFLLQISTHDDGLHKYFNNKVTVNNKSSKLFGHLYCQCLNAYSLTVSTPCWPHLIDGIH